MKLIGVGDSIFDAYMDDGVLYPGGNAVNVAVMARRFGAQQAAYMGVLGDDEPGRYFKRTLEEEGLDVSRVRVVHAPSAVNYIRMTADGDRVFAGNNCARSAQGMVDLHLVEQDYSMLEKYDVAHTSLHSRLDEALPSIARRVKLSLDFSTAYTERIVERFCPMLHFAFFSGDGKNLEEVKKLAHYAAACGARTVVVTRGSKGSFLLDRGKEHSEPCCATSVVDTLGAGDAYIAAFLTAYHDLDGDLPGAAKQASSFAALSCQNHGAFGHAYQTDRKGYEKEM